MLKPSRQTWLRAVVVSAPSLSTRYLPLSVAQLWLELANSSSVLSVLSFSPLSDIQWPKSSQWDQWTFSLTPAVQSQLWYCKHDLVLDKVLSHRQEAVCPYWPAVIIGCTVLHRSICRAHCSLLSIPHLLLLLLSCTACSFTDDTQLHIALTPLDPSSELTVIKSCLASLQLWFYTNPEKLHAILFGTAQRAQSFSSLHSTDVAGSSTLPDSNIKLLGVTLDSSLFMSQHNKLVSSRSCFYHIWALHHICGVLDLSTATAIVSALISSQLNYANSVLYGSPSKTLLVYREPKTLQQELLHIKHHIFVFGQYTPWTPLAPSSMVHQVQTCLSCLQGDAHWYSTLPLTSSYSIMSFSCSQVIFLL